MADQLNELLTQHVAGNNANGAEKNVTDKVVTPPATTEIVTDKVITPPATTTDTKVETPVFDESKYLGEINPNWKSKDDVKTVLSEYESLKQKASEFESTTKEYIKPANDFVKKLNEIAANGGNTQLFIQTNNIDVDKLSDAQAVALKLQWDKKYSPEDAAYKVNRQYLLNKKEKANELGETVPFTDEEKEDMEFQKIELRNDAIAAREHLKGFQVKAAEVPDIAKDEKERMSNWAPSIPKVLNEAGKLTKQLNIGTKEAPELIDFDFALSPTQQKVIQDLLDSTVKNAKGFDYNPETHKYAIDMATKWAWGEFSDEITNAISQKLASHYEEKYRKLTGATTRDKVDTPVNTEKKSATGQLVDFLS